jgi:hypothetical protein
MLLPPTGSGSGSLRGLWLDDTVHRMVLSARPGPEGASGAWGAERAALAVRLALPPTEQVR